jgi:hypothetical protein
MKRIGTLVVALALIVPGSALAQSSDSTCQAYNPQLCDVSTDASDATTSTTEGTLPFTGLDVALLAVGGGGLLGAGLVVRRLSRRLD